MSLIHILFFGLLPAGLLMWTGSQIRARAAAEGLRKSWLRFLLGGVGIFILIFIITWLIGERAFSLSAPILLPLLFGFATALGVHLLQERKAGTKAAISLFLATLLLLSWIAFSSDWMFLVLILLAAALTALLWLAWERNGKWYQAFFAVEVLLLGISIRVTDLNRIADFSPRWLSSLISAASYLIIPWIGVVMAALLVRRLMTDPRPLSWRAVLTTMIMVAILFLLIGCQAMLASLWDVATDGLSWVFLWLTASTIGIGSAMLMAWSLPRNQLWVPVLFALTVPLVLVQAHNLANYEWDHTWGTKPILTTERRAEKIERAIQRYYENHDRYPQTLGDLTPRYLLYIPNPFIIPGLDWCYEGGVDFYRFGYVHRQYFSVPASVRIHSSAGEPPVPQWNCEEDAELYGSPLGF